MKKLKIKWTTGKKIILSTIIIFILASIPIIFYITTFNNGLSIKQSDWGDFGDFLGGIISPFLSFLSFTIAIYVLFKSNEKEKFNHIYKFMADFRSKEMSQHIKLLWDFYNYENYKSRKKEYANSEKPKKLIERYEKEHEKADEIYIARRNVSFFYFYLAIFLKNNKLDNELLYELWSISGLETLEKIIIPCEESIKKGVGKPNKLDYFDILKKKLNEMKKSKNK
jgi:hypothetical protein